MKKVRNDSPFVYGNLKLPKTTAVLNVTPASLCPSRMLGLCQLKNPAKECYALREERVYPGCIPSRMKMTEYWDRNSPWTIASDLLAMNETKRENKITALRINECGDFRHQADLEKAEVLARFLRRGGVRTYCYTARRDLDYPDIDNLVVNGSGWMAHNRFQATGMTRDFYLAYDKEGAPVPCQALCPGDCRTCSRCLVKTGQATAVLLH